MKYSVSKSLFILYILSLELDLLQNKTRLYVSKSRDDTENRGTERNTKSGLVRKRDCYSIHVSVRSLRCFRKHLEPADYTDNVENIPFFH